MQKMIRILNIKELQTFYMGKTYPFMLSVLNDDLEGFIGKAKSLWLKLSAKEKIKLLCPYVYYSNIKLDKDYSTEHVYITKQGIFFFKAGFIWNGANGITLDTLGTRLASLVHDAGYELLPEWLKEQIDYELYRIMYKWSVSHKPVVNNWKDRIMYPARWIKYKLSLLRAKSWLKALLWFGSGISEEGKQEYKSFEDWNKGSFIFDKE